MPPSLPPGCNGGPGNQVTTAVRGTAVAARPAAGVRRDARVGRGRAGGLPFRRGVRCGRVVVCQRSAAQRWVRKGREHAAVISAQIRLTRTHIKKVLRDG